MALIGALVLVIIVGGMTLDLRAYAASNTAKGHSVTTAWNRAALRLAGKLAVIVALALVFAHLSA